MAGLAVELCIVGACVCLNTCTVLEMDYNMCLRRLFKYPPVEDVSLFVEKAMAIARPSPAQPVAAKKPSISSPPETRDREKKSGVKAAIKQLLDDPLVRAAMRLSRRCRRIDTRSRRRIDLLRI